MLRERIVLRQQAVIFEIRPGSKARSFSRKMARGTHKRQLWLLNDVLVVTKAVDAVYHELCRCHVGHMAVSDASADGACLLALQFGTGFVFTAHFESRSEFDRWYALLTAPAAEATFPYGMDFEGVAEEGGALALRADSGGPDAHSATGPVAVQRPMHPAVAASLEQGIQKMLGCVFFWGGGGFFWLSLTTWHRLIAAQEAALRGGSAAKATKKRQLRIQRMLYTALRQVADATVHTLRVEPAASASTPGSGPPASTPAPLSAEGQATRAAPSSWSVVDGYHEAGESLLVPAAPPALSGANEKRDNDSELVQALRRQLASRELELTKVKLQLHSIVNETWRKNLAVAELRSKSLLQVAEAAAAAARRAAAAPWDDVAADASTPPQQSPPPQQQESRLDTVTAHEEVAPCLALLPRSVLDRIVGYLGVPALGAMARCCRTLRDVVAASSAWQSRLESLLGGRALPARLAGSHPRDQVRHVLECGSCQACGSLEIAVDAASVRCCASRACLDALTLMPLDAADLYLLDTAEVHMLPVVVDVRVSRKAAEAVALAKYGSARALDAKRRMLDKKRRLLSLRSLGTIKSRADLGDSAPPLPDADANDSFDYLL